MKKYNPFLAAAVIASMTLAAACNDNSGDDTGTGLKGEIPSGTTLAGNITEDATLSENGSYLLSGGLHVKAGATLRIEPGVRITAVDDSAPDYILIEQGAKIDAQGTASSPIVMTSDLKEPGAWGGIHICGYARTNAGAGVRSEIGDAPYGGGNDADDSGTLRYIRLEYTGFALDEEHEANGISFYGVGSGTEVEYLQAYKGSDDGFEFFGGSVNVKHMVATDCTDDSFDWTEGWNGKGQFLVAYQSGAEECDCLMECDNNGTNFAAEPVAHPVLSNLTLAGDGSRNNTRGIRLRAGTQAEIYNAVVTGKENCISVETAQTEEALKSGVSKLQYIAMSSELRSDTGTYSNADFEAAAGNATDYADQLADGYIGTVTGGIAFDDPFFDDAPYKGAVGADDDWTAGWTL